MQLSSFSSMSRVLFIVFRLVAAGGYKYKFNNKLPAVGRPYMLIFKKSLCNVETESLFYLCIKLILERYKPL